MRLHSDWASNEVLRSTCFAWMDLYHIKNSRRKKKIDMYMLCRERHEILLSLTVLLVNYHDVGRILSQWILRQTGMKSPLKWHLLFINQENKIKDFSKVSNGHRNSKQMTLHFPAKGSASDWLKICLIRSDALPRSGSTVLNFFCYSSYVISRETSGGMTKCQLIKTANWIFYFDFPGQNNSHPY